MAGGYRRKKANKGYGCGGKAIKTKHRVRDLDEITEDLKPQNVRSMIRQRIDYDLPGAGQNYCVHCAKHFISDKALKEHLGSRPHKRRLKELEIEPYSIEESERAAGMGNYINPKRRKVMEYDDILEAIGEKCIDDEQKTANNTQQAEITSSTTT
ncbi:zinc finger protein 593-like isoform X2 [Varroa jacobsoni]|uniref:zinc finger protein 593-like isoform X2 n=1 Tax=Varroa jacobsoni TaxID=62625 RepID=UPI000BF7AD57|nr:zinc finger protein 593-like isoform X2 [Varroa jacobsoni]